MKKAKVLVNINYKDVFYPKDLILLESTAGVGNYYYSGNKNIETDFIVKNPDIFELIKEEPQEEVIEGWVEEKFIGNNWYEFIRYRKEDSKFTVPARFILNPKKRKEYVGYLSKKGLSEMQRGETPMYISMNKDKNYYIEITITVEEE
jgi:hypothetical protein